MKLNDYFLPFLLKLYEQIKKETRKTVVPKVIVATPKVKEQELVSRTREGITTKRDQVQITQEKVNTDISDVKKIILKLISRKQLTTMWYELLICIFLFKIHN
jgi:titin